MRSAAGSDSRRAQYSSGRQIAQTLFVSTKTVGTHLGHIYDKLTVNNREDLARIMREASSTPQ